MPLQSHLQLHRPCSSTKLWLFLLLTSCVFGGVPQTISFPPVPVKLTADVPFDLSATASSGLQVTYQIIGGAGVASISGHTVTLSGVPGAFTVQASQAGDGTYDPAPTVWQTSSVMGASPFAQVFSGSTSLHVLGIRSDGTLWAWGYNNYGQLGDASTTARSVPLQVGTGANWKSVATGQYFTLAIKTDGTLWAWGRNTFGQLGQGAGDASVHSSPIQVGTATNWKSVAAGQDHAVAVKTDGTLWTWGSNSNGQLGIGSSDVSAHGSPAQVGAVTTWSSVVAGQYHTIALRSAGTLWACGSNSNGQLGDGSTTQRTSFVQIGSVTTWQSIGAGQSHTLGVRTDGTLWAWGMNYDGELGDGTTTSHLSPVQAGTSTNWKSVVAGQYHSAGLKTDGSLWEWGINDSGQLGDGSFTSRSSPVQVGTATDWASVCTSGSGTVAVKMAGTLHGWGGNRGAFFSEQGYMPRSPLPCASIAGGFDTVAAGSYHSLAVRTDGTLWSWGYNATGALGDGTNEVRGSPVQVGSDSNWSGVASGSFHTLGIRTDGTLWAWGNNNNGQLGDGTTSQRINPVQVGSATNWKRAVGGSGHTLGIRTDGTLWSWGYNLYGQLGDGSTTQRTSPVQVGTDTNWMSAACGVYHSVAVRSDGTLWTWGYNLFGQLGNGGSGDSNAHSVPVRVGSATDWKSVAAGAYSTLAMKTDGTLWAWGDNNSGQLGQGTSDSVAHGSPLQIGSASDWKDITRGGYFTLALKNDGTLWSWGQNSYGQLGDGTSAAFRSTPAQIGSSTAWNKLPILSLSSHGMALTTDGTLWGWGSNSNGQLAGAGRDQRVANLAEPMLTSQTLAFAALPALVVGNTVQINAAASSGLPVSFIVHGPVTISGNQLTISGAGSVTVIAYQPGDSVWQASDIILRTGTSVMPDAPVVTTLPATQIGSTTATLNGSVNPNNSSTTVMFEYGTSNSYGNTIPANPGTVTGIGTATVFANAGPFSPGVTYHYRLSATNSGGTSTGGDLSFTLLTAAQSWRKTWFNSTDNSGDAADGADPDHDGIPNLLEFSCNLDPTKSSSPPGSAIRTGNNIEFTYVRSKAAIAEGVTFAVEWSDTLEAAGWSGTGVSESILLDDGIVQTVKATLFAGSSGRRFVHLKVTSPAP